MKRFISLIALIGLGIGLSACQDADPIAPDDVAPLFDKRADRSVVPVLTFADGAEVGSSHLVRTDGGVTVELNTTELAPGAAVTLWIVIFNNPSACATNPCTATDLFVSAVEADALYAAGAVVGAAGRATFAGRRNVGDTSGSLLAILTGAATPGLLDARTAEIHFVVRSHGPVIPELMPEMIQTFGAGCLGVPESGVLGTPGPNECADVQFAIHQP